AQNRTVAGTASAPGSEKRAQIRRLEVRECRKRGTCPKMHRCELQKLLQIAGVGLNGTRRRAAFAYEIRGPPASRFRKLGIGRGKMGRGVSWLGDAGDSHAVS